MEGMSNEQIQFKYTRKTASAIGLPIAACAVFPYSSLGLKFCMALIGITVVWAHRANIKKLMTGKESKLSFTKRVTEPDDK